MTTFNESPDNQRAALRVEDIVSIWKMVAELGPFPTKMRASRITVDYLRSRLPKVTTFDGQTEFPPVATIAGIPMEEHDLPDRWVKVDMSDGTTRDIRY